MYHPAGGIHEPKKMLTIRTDYVRLRQYLQGTLKVPKDEYENYEDYRTLEDPYELNEVLYGAYDLPLACDTETTKSHAPYCLTFSILPGTGYLIRANDRQMLQHFQLFLDQWRGPILFHNWLFDKDVVQAMGLRFPEHRIVDTMVRVFHLGNLPQGLKALSYRELGMKMQDFYDLVSPYSTIKCVDYIRRMQDIDWPKPDPVMERDKEGRWKVKQPHSIKTKVKTFFTYLSKDPEKNVFDAWANWEDSHELIEYKMGEPWPGLCITHAPEDKVRHYACRDSDALCRFYPQLIKMARRVRKTSQEYWNV